jgi:hypothetical protein
LNGQLRTEMKVTTENYKRPLIDCESWPGTT